MSDDLFVTLDHLHSAPGFGANGLCHQGARALCARYGLDWLGIVREGGISAHVLLATGDALAIRLVDFARQEVARGQQ